jgi:hypothetical protein
MTLRLTCRGIALGCAAVVGLQVVQAQQPKSSSNCAGLHAGITAQLTKPRQGYYEPSVFVSFLLLNDSATPQSTATESWKIIVDGKELPDSGYIFGNGPMPSGGYETLASGATFQFGSALPIAKYFPDEREYRVSWKGRHFQSPTVTIRIPTTKP